MKRISLKGHKLQKAKFDFEDRKDVHIRVDAEVKEKIIEFSDKINIPVQLMFECFTFLVSEEDKYLIRKILEYNDNKKNKNSEKNASINKRSYSSYDISTLINMDFNDD